MRTRRRSAGALIRHAPPRCSAGSNISREPRATPDHSNPNLDETEMARAIIRSELGRRSAREPLYDIDPRTGASIEVFYAGRVLAQSFSTRPGWFWWSCQRGHLPD